MSSRCSARPAILAALWGSLVALAQTAHAASEPARPTPMDSGAYHGGLISPLLPKPKFTLTDTSGAPYDFFARTQGFVTLLFFGYAHCPDVCPVQMHLLAGALRRIPPSAADQVKVVFVTTDPEQDTRPVLREFLDGFDRSFVGLTGNQAAIDAAQVAANLPVAKKTGAKIGNVSEVGHAAFVLAYTKDNLAHLIYPDGMKQEDWIHDLPRLAGETWGRP